jgi:hypothetical protein
MMDWYSFMEEDALADDIEEAWFMEDNSAAPL